MSYRPLKDERRKKKKGASKYSAVMVYHSVIWGGGSDGGGRGRIQALVGCVGNILGRVVCHRHHQCLFTFRFSLHPPKKASFRLHFLFLFSFSFLFFFFGEWWWVSFLDFWLAFSCVPRRHCSLGSTVIFLVFFGFFVPPVPHSERPFPMICPDFWLPEQNRKENEPVSLARMKGYRLSGNGIR
jgi:hypothetical protein